MNKSLYDEIRSEPNLFSAWRHVKRSALNSANNKIKGQAAEFEHRHQTHLATIGRQLREDRFVFDGVTGVLKDKKQRLARNKDPRPIAVASLRNRVVQRAILQILQPRRARDTKDIDTRYETVTDCRLGKINQINRSAYGVGGLLKPYGGVGPAIETISRAIDGGSRYFFQSDIKAFFTKIPTQNVVDIVQRETGEDKLTEIFSRGLEVNLANKDELATYANLFPSGGIGVAQGSFLSAFAGNVLLYDLDHELNAGAVTAVRYIDDLLIVAPSATTLSEAVDRAKRCLEEFGFKLYQPVQGSEKAAQGVCGESSINFLGCMLQPNRCVPSSISIKRLKKDVLDTLSNSKNAMNEFVRQGTAVPPRLSESYTIHAIGKKLFGWQKSFSFCNDVAPFAQLDRDIQKRIGEYRGFVGRICSELSSEQRMQIYGLPLTALMKRAD